MKFRVYFFLIVSTIILFACNQYRFPKTPNLNRVKIDESKFDSVIGYLNDYRSAYDVKYYDLDLIIDPSKKRIEGEVAISFKIVNATSRIQIELTPNFDIKQIANSKNAQLKFTREGKAILIDFEKEYNIGELDTIKVSYSGKPQIARKPPWEGGFVWKKTKGKPFVGIACEDDGASIWWPLKDHISDKPDSVSLSFTVPKGLFCVSNGKLTNRKVINNFQEKFTWQTSYPINTYNISFYLGDYRHFQLPYNNESGEHLLDFYVLPENFEKAKEHFRQTQDILKVYEEFFGEYPWWKDGYKLVESPYEGMEHQSAIAYGSRFKNSFTNFDYIIVHESAHEWWGNKITACDMADLWIHEGFATYAEALYIEKMNTSESSYDIQMVLNTKYTNNKYPLVGKKNVHYTNYKDGDIYVKGALVLHSLRTAISNDSIFFKILYVFVNDYSDKCVASEDFISLTNKVTGQDYSWLFEQLLFRPEAPVLLYQLKYISSNNYELLYKWDSISTNSNYLLPVKAEFDGEIHTLYPTNKLERVKIKDYVHSYKGFNLDQYIVFKKSRLEKTF